MIRRESLFLKACRNEKTKRTPIWLMRQAGRYMKEYRDLRAKYGFTQLCKNPDLATEVTVHAATTLGVDAAIIFSDILLILEPMGLDLTYSKGDGPVIANPVRSARDITLLKPTARVDPLPFLSRAIRQTRRALPDDLPLIGFSGAPFTLASYMIEGGSSKNFLHTKLLMQNAPKDWAALMQKVTHSLTASLKAQIKAGADAIQIFDSWVGCLSPEDYRLSVLPWMKKLIQSVKTAEIPVIYFGTQTAGLLTLMKETGADVIGLDWRVDLGATWKTLGKIPVQGNLDPATLLAPPADIRRQAWTILKAVAGKPGHIFNLGHGVLPQTPVDHARILIDTVKEFHA